MQNFDKNGYHLTGDKPKANSYASTGEMKLEFQADFDVPEEDKLEFHENGELYKSNEKNGFENHIGQIINALLCNGKCNFLDNLPSLHFDFTKHEVDWRDVDQKIASEMIHRIVKAAFDDDEGEFDGEPDGEAEIDESEMTEKDGYGKFRLTDKQLEKALNDYDDDDDEYDLDEDLLGDQTCRHEVKVTVKDLDDDQFTSLNEALSGNDGVEFSELSQMWVIRRPNTAGGYVYIDEDWLPSRKLENALCFTDDEFEQAQSNIQDSKNIPRAWEYEAVPYDDAKLEEDGNN